MLVALLPLRPIRQQRISTSRRAESQIKISPTPACRPTCPAVEPYHVAPRGPKRLLPVWASLLWLVWVVFPEAIPLARLAQVERSQVADCVGAVASPAHAAAFEPIADDRAARALDRTGTNLPTVGQVARVVHSRDVIAVVLCVDAMSFLNGGTARTDIERFEFDEHRLTAFVLQAMALLRHPLLPRCFVVGPERLSEFDQMFFGMPEIEKALGQRKVLAKELLQPNAAIGDRDLLLGLSSQPTWAA